MITDKNTLSSTWMALVDQLFDQRTLSDEQLLDLITDPDQLLADYLFRKARIRQKEHFGNTIYLRGLIEFTNYCRNDCLYCGIRRSNTNASRYRLSREEILHCCDIGHTLGFRTFVLQGGEDMHFSTDDMCDLISQIKQAHPDCALTLSVGEREKSVYQTWFDAGADRYLLRHETADPGHYAMLHPAELSLSHRMQCLYDLKDIGYQVGAGMMIGSPGQTSAHLLKDLRFLQELNPEMIGIGPFLPQKDTPLGTCESGSVSLTLLMLGILRLMFPDVLLPATTALGTADGRGREKGILAGANVIMPNLSPSDVREKYLLYDGKICTGEEAAQCHNCLERRIRTIGYEISLSRGDSPRFQPKGC